MRSRATRADVLVVRSTAVTAAMMDGGNLALIVRAGAGYNTIDVKGASARGIYVSNCPGKNAIAVAELAFGLILALDRRIPDNVASLRAGQWNKKEFSKARGLAGQTLGLLGFGNIGQELARRAQAFGLHLAIWSRRFASDPAADLGQYGLDTTARETKVRIVPSPQALVEQADIVSVHLALAPDTRGFVNADLFGRMKRGAMFINTARAEVVDYDALSAAVRDRGLRVGLDVFRNEPASATGEYRDDLLQLPGVYGTHHIGASTDQAQEAIAAETVRIVASFKDTGQVPNVVNLAGRTPATHRLIVRHRDRPGVLAHVFDHLRAATSTCRKRRTSSSMAPRPPSPASTSTGRPATRCWRRSRRATPTSSACSWSRSDCTNHDHEHEPRTRLRLPIAIRTPERHFHDHRDTHPQLLLRPRGAASARARAGAARSRRAAGRRHVGDGDQPSIGDVRRHHPEGGSGHPRAGRRSRELQGAVPAGRREPAVLDGAAQPADGRPDGRLHHDGHVGGQGGEGSEARRHGQRDRIDAGRQLQPHPRAGGVPVHAGRGLRAHHLEQHDRGHAVAGACRKSATRRSSATRPPTSSARQIDVSKHGLIYAGAQKNLGPSGVTLVIVREDLLARSSKSLHTMLNYAVHAENGSLYNTPPAFGVYVLGLVVEWLQGAGRSRRHRARERTQGRQALCGARSHRLLEADRTEATAAA